jgi:nitrogen fixation-related uncharacterized protein
MRKAMKYDVALIGLSLAVGMVALAVLLLALRLHG